MIEAPDLVWWLWDPERESFTRFDDEHTARFALTTQTAAARRRSEGDGAPSPAPEIFAAVRVAHGCVESTLRDDDSVDWGCSVVWDHDVVVRLTGRRDVVVVAPQRVREVQALYESKLQEALMRGATVPSAAPVDAGDCECKPDADDSHLLRGHCAATAEMAHDCRDPVTGVIWLVLDEDSDAVAMASRDAAIRVLQDRGGQLVRGEIVPWEPEHKPDHDDGRPLRKVPAIGEPDDGRRPPKFTVVRADDGWARELDDIREMESEAVSDALPVLWIVDDGESGDSHTYDNEADARAFLERIAHEHAADLTDEDEQTPRRGAALAKCMPVAQAVVEPGPDGWTWRIDEIGGER